MKLYTISHGAARCHTAVLRNCLSYQLAPLGCPVRKCRRDGFCSGPLVCRHEDGLRLVRGDCGDLGPADIAVPVCTLSMPEEVTQGVMELVKSDLGELHAAFSAWTIETTRVIAARRWRRLRWAEAPTEEPAPEKPPVIPPALC